MWLQRLPPQLRAILQASNEDLAALSKLADKIMDIGDFSHTLVNTTSSRREKQQSTLSSNNEMSLQQLQRQIQQISCQINELRSSAREYSNHRNRTKSLSFHHRAKSPFNSRKTDDLCWFHRRFGKNAKKCREPCAYIKTSKN